MEKALLRAHEEHLSIVGQAGNRTFVKNPKYGEDGFYTVTLLSDGRLECNCTAGQLGHVCKHAALVAEQVIVEDERQLRVSDRSFKEDYAQLVLASH